MKSKPKYKVGDKVSVPVRFGETGTVEKRKDGRYGVKFHNLPMVLWYNEDELQPQVGKGFSWSRAGITRQALAKRIASVKKEVRTLEPSTRRKLQARAKRFTSLEH